MIKKLILLLVLSPAVLMADSDTLLTVTQYGYRVANFMNMADSVNGTAKLPAAEIKNYVRMAFGTISLNISVDKTKYLPVVKGTRKYLVEAGLIHVRDVSRVYNNVTDPLEEVSNAGTLGSRTTYKDQAAGDERSQFYEVLGDSIRLFPTPIYNDTVVIEYKARPSHPYADTCVVQVPYEYKNALIYLAAFISEVSVRGPMADVYWKLYDNETKDIKSRMADRWSSPIEFPK